MSFNLEDLTIKEFKEFKEISSMIGKKENSKFPKNYLNYNVRFETARMFATALLSVQHDLSKPDMMHCFKLADDFIEASKIQKEISSISTPAS